MESAAPFLGSIEPGVGGIPVGPARLAVAENTLNPTVGQRNFDNAMMSSVGDEETIARSVGETFRKDRISPESASFIAKMKWAAVEAAVLLEFRNHFADDLVDRPGIELAFVSAHDLAGAEEHQRRHAWTEYSCQMRKSRSLTTISMPKRRMACTAGVSFSGGNLAEWTPITASSPAFLFELPQLRQDVMTVNSAKVQKSRMTILPRRSLRASEDRH